MYQMAELGDNFDSQDCFGEASYGRVKSYIKIPYVVWRVVWAKKGQFRYPVAKPVIKYITLSYFTDSDGEVIATRTLPVLFEYVFDTLYWYEEQLKQFLDTLGVGKVVMPTPNVLRIVLYEEGFVTMLKKFILSSVMVVLLFLFTGCFPRYYSYEGYIIDFISKKPITGAQFLINDKIIKTDKRGYFKFTASSHGEFWNSKCQDIENVTAEGYGTLEFFFSLYPDKVYQIPLMKPTSIYGTLIYDGNKSFNLVLKKRFEEDGEIQEEVIAEGKPDEQGDFYFLNVLSGELLNLYIYEEGTVEPIKSEIFVIRNEKLIDYKVIDLR